jgi:Raf kinase inhibitor-like YbhB/YbcL family protein
MTLERPQAEDPYAKLPPVASFTVTSADFENGQPLPASATGTGLNQSPQLTWSDVPQGTESFVVTCFDPDAPTPSGFWHWVVADLPQFVTSLDAGAGESNATLPQGAFHLRNDLGHAAYDGAGPPEGDPAHRYYFVVHAVRGSALGIGPDASPAVVSFNLAFKTLGRAIIVGTHQA